VQDGISETNHQVLAYLLVTSDEWLGGLDDDVREQFLKIVDEVTIEANAQVAAKEAANRQKILDAGSTIRVLTPEQRKAWVDAMKPVWTQFRDDIGQDLIEAAQASNDAG
jgi:C4-dicarboxylate-binding protein DctP